MQRCLPLGVGLTALLLLASPALAGELPPPVVRTVGTKQIVPPRRRFPVTAVTTTIGATRLPAPAQRRVATRARRVPAPRVVARAPRARIVVPPPVARVSTRVTTAHAVAPPTRRRVLIARRPAAVTPRMTPRTTTRPVTRPLPTPEDDERVVLIPRGGCADDT